MNTEEKESAAKESEVKDVDFSRVVISKEAELALAEVVDAANDGFEAGRITRLDAASHMLLWYKTNAGPDAMTQLRMSCCDEMTMLDKLVKRAKASGELPPELKQFLAQQFFGEAAPPPKKSKKSLKQEYITDIPNERKAS